jgi:hypothetical protein
VKSVCDAGYAENPAGKCVPKAEADREWTEAAAKCPDGSFFDQGRCVPKTQALASVPSSSGPDHKTAIVLSGERIQYIDHNGKGLFSRGFDVAGGFSEGRAVTGKLSNGKWPEDGCWYQIWDRSGKQIQAEGCPHVSRFESGLLPASVKQFGNVGYLDRNGRFAIQPRYFLGQGFSDGAAVVSSMQEDGQIRCGYILPSGRELVAVARYAICAPFSNGYAAVSEQAKNGKAGYIDKTGSLRLPAIYDFAGPFSEGRAYVVVKDEAFFIDATGKKVLLLRGKAVNVPVYSEGLAAVQFEVGSTGFINPDGKMVIPAKFLNAGPFREGVAPVSVRSPGGRELWGYIRKDGSWALAPRYFLAQPFNQGVAVVGDTGSSQ